MALESPNNFEEEWQKAFENASFSPPSDMWDRIERELEEKKRRPFIFFMRPSAIFAGVAAALILVLGGILFFNKNISNKAPDFAQNKTIKKNNIDKSTLESNSEANIVDNTKKQDLFTENQLPSASSKNTQSEIMASHEKIKSSKESYYSLAKSDKKNTKALASSNKETPAGFSKNLASTTLFSGDINKNFPEETTQTPDIQQITLSKSVDFSKNLTADLKIIKPKEYRYFGSRYTLKREKLIFDTEIEDSPIIASNDSKFWIGLQSGVSPFDPNIKLDGLNAVAFRQADAFAQTSSIPSSPNLGANSPSGSDKPVGNVVVSQPQNTIKAGVGTNTGIALGYKIAKKWNFESGIRYLRGNSTLQTNSYTFQQNGYANTFLADYLSQNSSNSMKSTNTVIADAAQFGNRYEYLMIPMQVGYEIGIAKNLGFNVLAGVSADLFLQNTLTYDKSLLQDKNTINNSSHIYKPLNLSGITGVRATYLISKHWQATLGSSYQQSLFSGINSSTALQMRLHLFGVNYGVNYRF